MHYSTRRHRASILGTLFACSISLAIAATPAIAETDDAAEEMASNSTDTPIVVAAPSEEDLPTESAIASATGDEAQGFAEHIEATTSDASETAPDGVGEVPVETQSDVSSGTQASDCALSETSSDSTDNSPQQEDAFSEDAPTVPTASEPAGSEGNSSTTMPIGEVAAASESDTTLETLQETSETNAPKATVSAGDLMVEGSYHLMLSGTSRVVEVRSASTSDGAQIWLYPTNGKQHQKIYLERDSEGYYTAWIVGTGKVLDVKGGSTQPGTKIIQWTNRGGDNQKWAVLSNGDGTYRLVNKATGLVLGKEESGYGLVGIQDAGTLSSMFLLNPVNLLSAGIYRIAPRTNNATTLDVAKASTKNGANLILYKNTGALNQRFELITAGGDNLWFIRTASSGGWVTYKDGKLMQDGSKDSKPIGLTWRSTFQGGWYSLINVRSGKALDMYGGSTKSGTDIIAYRQNGRDSQHFTFIQSDLITPGTYTLDSGYGTRIEVYGNSKAMGANVQTWKKKASSNNLNQRFRIVKKGAGFVLVNANSGLVVAVTEIFGGGSSGRSTHNASQRFFSGKNNQIWKASIEDGGFVRLTNAASGMSLTTASGTAGANVYQGSESAGSSQQKWKFTKASSDSAAPTQVAKTKVLFIGNSFTFYEDLPRLVGQKLSKTEVVSCTRGSALLSHHLSNTDSLGQQTQQALADGGWDYVVIQEMSTRVIDDYDAYLSDLRDIASLIEGVGATPIIYQTWAFESGTGSQGYGSIKRGITNAEMHAQLQAGFNLASEATGVAQAKAGSEIASSNSSHTAFDSKIYASDKKHLSAFGAELVAKVFATLFKSLS